MPPEGRSVSAVRYCRCPDPDRRVVEGIEICAKCGDRIVDPILRAIYGEVREITGRLDELERKLSEPMPPEPEWLAPKELAQRLGRSVDFVYSHSAELGAKRVGDGPRPRLLFPVSSGAFRVDSGQ